jgi:hypothetical protein
MGFRLTLHCDGCDREFTSGNDGQIYEHRLGLDANNQGWQELNGGYWLCKKCVVVKSREALAANDGGQPCTISASGPTAPRSKSTSRK